MLPIWLLCCLLLLSLQQLWLFIAPITTGKRETPLTNYDGDLQKWKQRAMKEARRVGRMRIRQRKRDKHLTFFCDDDIICDPSCLYEVLLNPFPSVSLNHWNSPCAQTQDPPQNDPENQRQNSPHNDRESSTLSDQTIRVLVKNNDSPPSCLEKKYVNVTCKLGDTIEHLKQRALQEFNVSAEGCKLWHGTSGTLNVSKTLLDYGITDGATLNLTRGGLNGGAPSWENKTAESSIPNIQPEDPTNREVEQFLLAFENDVKAITANYHIVQTAIGNMQARENAYRDTVQKVQLGIQLSRKEQVMVLSLKKLCGCEANYHPSLSLSWAAAYAKRIWKTQHAWDTGKLMVIDSIVGAHKNNQNIDMMGICEVQPWNVITNKYDKGSWDLENAVASSIQLMLHFIMQTLLVDAPEEQLSVLSTKIPKNVALTIAGYATSNTPFTKKNGRDIRGLPPSWEELTSNLKEALFHHELRMVDQPNTATSRIQLSKLTLRDGEAFSTLRNYTEHKQAAIVKLLEHRDDENAAITAISDINNTLKLDGTFRAWLEKTAHNNTDDIDPTLSLKLKKMLDDIVEAANLRSEESQPKQSTTANHGEKVTNVSTERSIHTAMATTIHTTATPDIQNHHEDEGTFKTFQEYFATKHINGSTFNDDANKPKVTRHTFKKKGNDGEFTPEVIKIKNAMGRAYINQFINLYSQDSVRFHEGARGREGSYMRFVTTNKPEGKNGTVAYFQIGLDAHAERYACEQATSLETKYLKHINRIADAALKARHGQHYEFIPYNALAIVVYDCSVNAGFKWHDDKNKTHVLQVYLNDKYPSDQLPKEEDFTVWTSTFMKDFIPGKPLQVRWADDEDKKNVPFRVNIGNDHAHFQSRYVNSNGRQHTADYNSAEEANIPKGNHVRVVLTARVLTVPGVSQEGFDQRAKMDNFDPRTGIRRLDDKSAVTNPIAEIENRGSTVYFSDEEDQTNINNKPPASKNRSKPKRTPDSNSTKIKIHEWSDRWPQCSNDDYKKYCIKKLLPHLICDEPAATFYARAPFHRMLLEKKIFLRVLSYPTSDKDDSIIDISKPPKSYYQLFCFQSRDGIHFPQAGGWYRSEAVTANADIKWGNSKPPCPQSDPYSVVVFINTKMYKLNKKNLEDFLNGDTKELEMICSGGAPMENGSFGVDLANCINAENLPWATMPKAQSMNKMNATLDKCASGNKLLFPFISPEVYCEATNKTMNESYKGKLRCLGLTRIKAMHIVEGLDDAEMETFYAHLSSGDQTYARYAEMPHRKLILAKEEGNYINHLPTMNPETEEIEKGEGWRVLTVTNCEQIRPTVNISRKAYTNCIGLGENRITTKTFRELHFENTLKSLIPMLPKPTDIKVFTQTNPANRPDSEPWFTKTKNQHNDLLPKSITVSDMIKSLVAISYAGCSRYLGDCIKINSSGLLCAHPLQDRGQGAILRYNATPMPSRTADTASIAIMNACLRPPNRNSHDDKITTHHSTPYQRIQTYSQLDDTFKANFFRCLMCSIYGQTEGLTKYVETGDSPDGNTLPSHLQADAFADHIDKYSPNKSVCTAYYRHQYKDAIPGPLKSNKETALSFIKCLANNWDNEVEALFDDINWLEQTDKNGNNVPACRRTIMLKLAQVIKQYCPGEKKFNKYVFIASQCMNAMQEIYFGNPFGDVKLSNVPLGVGSTAGIKVLAPTASDADSQQKKKKRKKTTTNAEEIQEQEEEDNGDVKWLNDLLTKETYDAIMGELLNLPEAQLDVLLLTKDLENEEQIVSKLNGRPVCAIDVEHFPCKVYIVLRLKQPVAVKTLQPDATSRKAWPVRTTKKVKPMLTCPSKDPFLTATKAWESFVVPGKIWMPAPFLFLHETPRCQHGYSFVSNATTPQALFPSTASNSQQHQCTTQPSAQKPPQKKENNPSGRKRKCTTLTPPTEQASEDSDHSDWENYNTEKKIHQFLPIMSTRDPTPENKNNS